ncbi:MULTISPECIES: zinc ribbon domain-containing protein [unclassified Breznakia]|uniref:zinc ribbon domain-containing protein n=1 Tax=unclassified Breznakia TaxID=2623764 RepID=UPI002472F048|nr:MULTISPECIES: zinc ribbon domain-containing protein [unclassified Breznakia]MDH6366266.1 hypothetical protein [Breznakia sp. PH1-1]MDH6403359.1 hypothetical protein [Breznakia sp. PF1-11]MDH6411068.1 hypothetical protein [Breznakia sp. PFB1-11]MDH6413432.1 hypothetical protein [Breznakia sp. PFB1-14]MDH6416779.1 hypothetical protein [Breznakia sp. PFB1-4]
MKCEKCGTNINRKDKFCSNCGNEVKVNTNENKVIDTIKKEAILFWSQLTLFGRVMTVSIVIFSLLGIIAYLFGSKYSFAISVIQIVLVVVSFLIKEGKIKSDKTYMYIIVIAVSFVLMIPYKQMFGYEKSVNKQYSYVSTSNKEEKNEEEVDTREKFEWSEIELSKKLPKPKSIYGSVIANSQESLKLEVHEINSIDYDNYVTACEEKGFAIELEKDEEGTHVYNADGYLLFLKYSLEDEIMNINLEKPMDLHEITWSTSELAKMIPTTNSLLGVIENDDEKNYSLYVGNMSKDDYIQYIENCKGMGYSESVENTSKTFSAKNSNGNTLEVEYVGNKLIHISVTETKFELELEVDCKENLIFSTYDVEIFIDDEYVEKIKHGDKKTYNLLVTKGEHTLKFISASDESLNGKIKFKMNNSQSLKYKISCSRNGVSVETKETSNSLSEDIESNQTTDNSKLYYSTNTKEQACNGNSGKFAYRESGSYYDKYYIIDFDEGYVYFFTDGNGDDGERVRIESGTLNDTMIITWHDGSDTWSYYLHFKYKQHPETLMVTDNDGFQMKFSPTDLSKALNLKNSKNIKDY